METTKKRLHYGYVIVIGAFIQYFVCSGILYNCMPLFTVPCSESFGIGQGTFTLWTTIFNVATAVCAMFMSKLVSKFKFKTLNLIAIVVAGLLTMSLAFAPGVWMFYICGAFIGACMPIMIVMYNGTMIPRWFKNNISSVIATVLIGPRVGGIILNPITSSIINNGAGMFGFDEGWRAAFLVLGAIVLVVGFLNCLLLMRESPASMGLLRVGEVAGVGESVHVETVKGVRRNNAVKSKSFIFFALMVICLNLFTPMFSYLPAYAQLSEAGAVATFDLKGIINSVLLVGAIVGGYIIGFCNDKFGGHIGALVGGILGAIGLIVAMLGYSDPIVMLAGAAIFGLPACFTGLQYPAMALTLYGRLDYEKIYTTITPIAPWLGAVSFSLWGFVYDATGSYTPMFIIGAVLSLLTSLFGMLSKASSKSLADKWEAAEVETKI